MLGLYSGCHFRWKVLHFLLKLLRWAFSLYGWNRFNKWFHWMTGIMVGVSGIASGILVVSANSWMNNPAGFDYVNGQYINIDPIKAMFNGSWFSEALHMTIAAFSATGFAVAGIHALMIARKQNVLFHTKAFQNRYCFRGRLRRYYNHSAAIYPQKTRPKNSPPNWLPWKLISIPNPTHR